MFYHLIAHLCVKIGALDSYAIQNPFQAESKPFLTNCRALYCHVKGWQYKSSAEFKRSELVVLQNPVKGLDSASSCVFQVCRDNVRLPQS